MRARAFIKALDVREVTPILEPSCYRAKGAAQVDSFCRRLMVPLFRGSNRFESFLSPIRGLRVSMIKMIRPTNYDLRSPLSWFKINQLDRMDKPDKILLKRDLAGFDEGFEALDVRQVAPVLAVPTSALQSTGHSETGS